MMKNKKEHVIAQNKKAYHNFEILEKLEAGLVLKGYEVKSIRMGHVSLNDCYARIIQEELWLIGGYIKPYAQAHGVDKIDPTRSRKLLIHKRELNRWVGKVQEKGLTIVPLKLYFNKNVIKLQIALGRSKKQFDKRQDKKRQDIQRDIQKNMKIKIR